MTQLDTRKESKESVGSLRSWSINRCVISSCNVSVSSPPTLICWDPWVHLSCNAFLNPPSLLPFGWHCVFLSHTRKTEYKTVYACSAGFKKVRDTECSERTAICPAAPFLVSCTDKGGPRLDQSDLWKVGKETSETRITFQFTLTD